MTRKLVTMHTMQHVCEPVHLADSQARPHGCTRQFCKPSNLRLVLDT